MKKEVISLSPRENINVVENERIENSPFSVCGNEDQGYVIVIGKNMVSQKIFESKNEAMEYCKLENISWNDLLVATSIVAMHIIDNRKNKKK